MMGKQKNQTKKATEEIYLFNEKGYAAHIFV